MSARAPVDDAARRRARRVAVQVFAVEFVTLIALWALGALFGPS
jgi:hypothetical protein